MSRTDPNKALAAPLPFLRDPSIDSGNFDLTTDRRQIETSAAAIDAPIDWSKFLAKGGKVIYHIAADDYLTNGRNQMSMYESLQRTTSKALLDKNARFYVTPGGDHGSRSYSFPEKQPQPMHSDLIGILERWVEHGQTPPDAVREMLMDIKAPYAVSKERPLCRYPAYPRYKGVGDPSSFDSYVCATS